MVLRNDTQCSFSPDSLAVYTSPMTTAGKWWNQSLGLRLKRGVDIVGASVGLLATGPLMLGVALAARRDGPAIFSQPRPGYKGETFVIHKFRTMREPRQGEVRFRSDSERVTKLGLFLRKSSIDELPELWNVLKGEMSLVGPRPLLVAYLEKYTHEEARRHNMPPGITGWAQVNGRQTIPFSERLKLDVWYVDNWSLLLDLQTLFKTVAAVFVDSHETIDGASLDVIDDIGLSSDRKRTQA